ncbi:MAG: restriction endonuclease [Mycoplasmatota bacterium]
MNNYEKGKFYEKFTLEIITEFLNEIKTPLDKIEHNITLNGISGATHQIDVLITKRDGSRVIIECKNYESNVCQEKIQSFITVKNDLKNISDMYFVTKTGYQPGAINIANYFGVKLINLDSYHNSVELKKYNLIHQIKIEMKSTSKNNIKINLFDNLGNELKSNFWFDGEIQYHTKDLINYFGSRRGVKVDLIPREYQECLENLSEYNIKPLATLTDRYNQSYVEEYEKCEIIIDKISFSFNTEVSIMFSETIDDSDTKAVTFNNDKSEATFYNSKLGNKTIKLKR